MTEREYLTKRLEGMGVTENDIELILLKYNASGNDPVNPAHTHWLDAAIYKNFSIVAKCAIGKITEGGYSIENSMKALNSFYNLLKKELGIMAYHI